MSIKSQDKSIISRGWGLLNQALDALIPMGDLIIRYWVAKLFFFNALAKFPSWQSTVLSFTYEHELPALLDKTVPTVVTWLSLVFSVFLLLGLGGRLPALFLFILNLIAVATSPVLFTTAGHFVLSLHVYWGLMLMILMLHGPGKLSLDYLFCKKDQTPVQKFSQSY